MTVNTDSGPQISSAFQPEVFVRRPFDVSAIQVTADNMEEVCRAIKDMGPEHIILTLGSRGSYIFDNQLQQYVESFSVKAVDSTAAGDTFCGALAVSILRGDQDIIGAVRFANAAGALSVTRQGAQTSIPDLGDIEKLLA